MESNEIENHKVTKDKLKEKGKRKERWTIL